MQQAEQTPIAATMPSRPGHSTERAGVHASQHMPARILTLLTLLLRRPVEDGSKVVAAQLAHDRCGKTCH